MSDIQDKPLTPAIKLEKWGAGAWVDEPDHLAFEHVGMSCILHRHPSSGHWCGYVAVPPGHPWHGKDGYSENQEIGLEVHGGPTYGDKCDGEICHVAKPGEPDDVWWIGFDCAHSGDLAPCSVKMDARLGFDHRFRSRDSYKTIDYITQETKRAAEQARDKATAT